MKISRDWLTDYIDLSGIDDDDLAGRLTAIGHAIDSVETRDGDTVLEVEFTSNRVDAMSHLGLARELGAALGREVRFPAADRLPAAGGSVEVRIEAPELCDRYTAHLVHGVTVGPSSEKVRRRLEAVGLRPINNVVDATNYVMLALGHPLHAFDLRQVRGNRIVVRAGRDGEKFRTLDGEERTLDRETTVIADAERAVAIGGIMGGANSEIAADTKDVLLECAHFDPAAVRKAARRMGMKTDASYRFERGVDPADTILAVSLCADLIAAEAGGKRGDLVDEVARPVERRRITLRESRLRAMSDGHIGPDEVLDLLRRLGMEAERVEGGIDLVVPTWRGDVSEEIDLIEEALRFFGYDAVRSSLPRVTTGDMEHDEVAELEDRARELLVGAGLVETIGYAFIHPDQNLLFFEEEPLAVTNALTANISSMRLSMAPGLLATVAFNRSYGNRDGGVFEIGRTYHRGEAGAIERSKAGVVLFGQTGAEWGETRRAWDFFDLKGVVEELAGRLHVELSFEPVEARGMRPGAVAEVSAGERRIGIAGAVAREALEPFELKGEVWFAEIDLGALAESRGVWQMKPVSRFPGVPMVLAMMHPPELRFRTIVETIRSMNVPHLERIGLWDRFVPPGGDEVKTALGMWYQAPDRSLTQEEIAARHEAIARGLAERLPVRILA
ncbi:MAG TPA: phenylalanine--tRNA ligase subunit beta [Thermoanaerobaculia bacterium]|nr:phenylalanine--tRNA ligase subunit beta [Thermoanaerobaculia bacterium]